MNISIFKKSVFYSILVIVPLFLQISFSKVENINAQSSCGISVRVDAFECVRDGISCVHQFQSNQVYSCTSSEPCETTYPVCSSADSCIDDPWSGICSCAATTVACYETEDPPPDTCGDGNLTCDPDEDPCNCPEDCPGTCGSDPTPTTCSVSLTPKTVVLGETEEIGANLDSTNASSTSYSWSVSGGHTNIVDGINTNPTVIVRGGNTAGTDTLSVDVTVSGNGSYTCSASTDIEAIPPRAWFQVRAGNAISVQGMLRTRIPIRCTTQEENGGVCRDEFIVEDVDENNNPLGPGIVIAPGDSKFNYADDSGGGTANINNWIAKTEYSGESFNYDYFERIVDTKQFYSQSGGDIRQAINAATPDTDGYKYIKITPIAGQTVNIGTGGVINIGQNEKVVVLVDGDVYLNKPNPGQPASNAITVREDRNGFFMLVASGNIEVDPQIATYGSGGTGNNVGVGGQHALEGIFITDGTFNTGTFETLPATDLEFSVKGMVVAHGGFELVRDRGDLNDTRPGEVFEYTPEFAYYFPTSLGQKHFFSREVIP